MVEAEILTELLKQSPLIAVLGIGLYIFYKKDDQRRAEDKDERLQMKKKIDENERRIEDYMKQDRAAMQEIVHTNAQAIETQTLVMKSANSLMMRSNEVMTCLITEIKDFKKSPLYKTHERSKVA